MTNQPLLSIPLDLPDVRILSMEVLRTQELIIDVESTLTTTTCRTCGRTISDSIGRDRPIKLRHLPILGYVVYIRLRPKRFGCPYCDDHPTTTQHLMWYRPKALHTIAYQQHLLVQLVNSTVEDVCQKEDVSSDAMVGVLDQWVAPTIDWATVPTFHVLGIDEIALKKGHRDFVAIVTARLPEASLRVLAVLPDRSKATLVDWLRTIPAALGRHIHTVCTDMWEAYVHAVQEVVGPRCSIVIDRYHVATHYYACADMLRKQEVKRLRQELPQEEADQLKASMWPFRKRPADLEPDQRERLARFFARAAQLQQAYDLREQLTTIFDTARSKAAALRHIKRWRRAVTASGLSCFDPFLKLLDTWLDLIANSFRQRQTSGFVEGLNNKLKVLKRRCFGVFNLQRLFQRISLDLDGYRRFSRWHQAPPYNVGPITGNPREPSNCCPSSVRPARWPCLPTYPMRCRCGAAVAPYPSLGTAGD